MAYSLMATRSPLITVWVEERTQRVPVHLPAQPTKHQCHQYLLIIIDVKVSEMTMSVLGDQAIKPEASGTK